MGAVSAGAVVLVRFPFSDLSQSKLRPAVVLADAGCGDFVLCQVTSRRYGDESAIEIGPQDFASGSLPLVSYARPGKLFTAHESLLGEVVAGLSPLAFDRVIDAIVRVLRGGAL